MNDGSSTIPLSCHELRRIAWAVERLEATAAGHDVALPVANLCDRMLGRSWRESTGCLRVSLSQDDDCPTTTWPACCTWTASGLNFMPPRQAAMASILDCIAGDMHVKYVNVVPLTRQLSTLQPAATSLAFSEECTIGASVVHVQCR